MIFAQAIDDSPKTLAVSRITLALGPLQADVGRNELGVNANTSQVAGVLARGPGNTGCTAAWARS